MQREKTLKDLKKNLQIAKNFLILWKDYVKNKTREKRRELYSIIIQWVNKTFSAVPKSLTFLGTVPMEPFLLRMIKEICDLIIEHE